MFEAVSAKQQPESLGVGSGAYVRLLAALLALGAGAAAVIFGVLLVRGLPAIASSPSISAPGSSAPAAPAPAPAKATSAEFPAPPRGAVVIGAAAGEKVLALAVVPGRGKIALQASVLDGQGQGVKGLAVRFDVAGASGRKTTTSATPCGNGCYRAAVGVARPRHVEVRLSGERPVSFAMPKAWPPQPAAGIVRRAGEVWRELRTLAYRDRLGDGNAVLVSDWKVVSPDRIEFKIVKILTPKRNEFKLQKSLGAGVIIGGRRWDMARGSTRWLAGPQLPVEQPVPFWQSATNVYLHGTVVSRGRPAWKLSFYDGPGGPAWFTIVVDKATLHTTELWMTAPAHFMRETYHSFNAPITIEPPSNEGLRRALPAPIYSVCERKATRSLS